MTLSPTLRLPSVVEHRWKTPFLMFTALHTQKFHESTSWSSNRQKERALRAARAHHSTVLQTFQLTIFSRYYPQSSSTSVAVLYSHLSVNHLVQCCYCRISSADIHKFREKGVSPQPWCLIILPRQWELPWNKQGSPAGIVLQRNSTPELNTWNTPITKSVTSINVPISFEGLTLDLIKRPLVEIAKPW